MKMLGSKKVLQLTTSVCLSSGVAVEAAYEAKTLPPSYFCEGAASFLTIRSGVLQVILTGDNRRMV